MIVVKLEGRLGNQLFQYAFAYSTSKSLSTQYYLNQKHQSCILTKYFNISTGTFNFLDKSLFSIKGFKNIFSYHLKRSFYSVIDNILKLEKINEIAYDTSHAHTISLIRNNAVFEGYFQSELFFEFYKNDIKKKLTIKSQYSNSYLKKYQNLFSDNNKIVAVHIRRTDYQNRGILKLGADDLTIPSSYYYNLIDSIKKKHMNPLFIFIGDDISFMETMFKNVQNKYISKGDEITDFQHLLNADICIISNSTFSWWAAYLNNKKDKLIYAPKYFLGIHIKKTMPPEIYPDNWTLVDT